MTLPWEEYAAPSGPWAEYAQQPAAKPQPNVAVDVAKQLPTGVARGVAETLMLPVTINRAAKAGADWLFNKGESAVRSMVGAEPLTEEMIAKRKATLDNSPAGALDRLIYGAQDSARGTMDAALPKPETTAGEYARTVGEFAAPGVLGKGTLVEKLIGNTLVPALVSETAGQATKGTAAEPWARAIGGVGGNVAVAAKRAHQSAVPRAVNDAVSGVTPEQFDQARELVRRSADELNIGLTAPEAIQQATGGATKLGDLQRVVEGSLRGGNKMNTFMAERPGQTRMATDAVIDGIAPPSTAPSTIGPRASEAASAVLDDANAAVNRTTRPLYQAAEGQTLDPAAFATIQADPAFQAALRDLRSNEILGPLYAHLPDDAVGVIDAVTKRMYALGESAGNSASGGFNPQTASVLNTGAREAREAARTAVPEYDQALTLQADARRNVLQPLEQGPVGAVAGTQNTHEAGLALLPQQTMRGQEGELADATRRLVGQDADTTGQLVAQRLRDQYDQSAGALVGGQNQFGGAKFARDIAGTPQREANLNAVVGALPAGAEVDPSMQLLLQALRATGQRKPIGSQTSFNTAIQNDLGTGTAPWRIADAVRSGGLTIPSNVKDAAQRAWLGRNTERLADMFTDPQGVDAIEMLSIMGQDKPFMDALMRSLGQAPLAQNPGPGAR